MIELGQLEAEHKEFEKRKTRVIVASMEGQTDSKLTQADFPHLVVVADADRKLVDAVAVLHPDSGPGGIDTATPTTILIDGAGQVRWVFRPERFFDRLSPAEVLQAVDEKLIGK
jgi:alkyl hydroperoxide reductase subunit AhpC